MEFLKSLMTKALSGGMLKSVLLGGSIEAGVGFDMEKVKSAARTAVMTGLAVGSLAAIGVLDAAHFGLLEGASVALFMGAQDYIRRHFKNYLPPQV